MLVDDLKQVRADILRVNAVRSYIHTHRCGHYPAV